MKGEQYNRLTVVRYDRLDIAKSGKRYHRWWCRCSCGNPELKSVRMSALRGGMVKSCGCLHSETSAMNARIAGLSNLRHGHAVSNKTTMTYSAWRRMKTAYGSDVDPRWFKSFKNFLLDMGLRPEGKKLERVDPNGKFERNNVKWSTK